MKYKHKITGDIAIMKSNNSAFYNYDGMDIHARIIENSNDWEKIIEKDYEILSYYDQVYNCYYKPDSQLKNKWCKKDGIAPFFIEDDLKLCNIYSIKRLSDNTIFTIGDNINYKKDIFTWDDNKSYCRIEEFSLHNNYIYVNQHWMGDVTVKISDWVLRNNILFITEDGVEIFEGDKIWFVDIDYWLVETRLSKKGDTYKNRGLFPFSKKEKAEEYVILNKPCLSAKDVIDWITNSKPHSLSKAGEIALKELVKSKL
jgi:hypothetical protein